jgi:hypothetical protein
MRFHRIVIGAICVILTVSPAWSAPRGIGDTGGIKGAASPQLKKLSPKAGAACFRACMHGVSGAGWGNFCDAACYGG